MTEQAHPLIGKRVIARTYMSGVSIGVLHSFSTADGIISYRLTDALRLWSWDAAFTLSEVAANGPESARIAYHPESGIYVSENAVEFLVIGDDAYKRLVEVATVGAL